MANHEQAQTGNAARNLQPRAANPQPALAPGKEAPEAAADRADPTDSVQRHADVVNGIMELADKEEYVDEP
jgi:hypothetical protein